MNAFVLIPITDEDGPEWIRNMALELPAAAVEAGAGLVSIRGTSPDDDAAWAFVITAAVYDGRWQVHASWHDEDGHENEAAYAVVPSTEAK